MTDARRRELERRWLETGAAADEAALLVERVRVGELTLERLELAAFCAHPAAVAALGPAAPALPSTWRAWVSGAAKRAKQAECAAFVEVMILAGKLLAQRGLLTHGPRVSTLHKAVSWARSAGATDEAIRDVIARSALRPPARSRGGRRPERPTAPPETQAASDPPARDPERDGRRARALTERVRAGELSLARLQLAAYLGDEAARIALGAEAPAADRGSTVGLVLGLKPYGPEVFARAAMALAALSEEHAPAPEQSRALRLGLDAWIVCPCEAHAGEVAAAAAPLGGWDLRFVGPVVNLAKATVALVTSALSRGRGDITSVGEAARQAQDLAAGDRVARSFVVDALLAWALGST